MSTKQRVGTACGRRALLAELGISDGPKRARRTPARRSARRSVFSCRCPECVDAQWDIQRLKYWMVARLLAYGADEADVDQRIGDVRVDIAWRIGERQYAIEVRSGPLDAGLAQEHTQRLRAAGCVGVLWLCPPGDWVSQVPALGIANFAPPACDYRLDRGMWTVEHGVVAVQRRDPYELRDFLRGWLAGEIVWGYRDVMNGGWATVKDWEQHTKTQSGLIDHQHQELVNQRTALAVSRQLVRDKQRQLMKLNSRLARAVAATEERDDALAKAQRALADQRRVDNGLRDTITTLNHTIGHWQLITVSTMMLIVTFLAAAMVLR